MAVFVRYREADCRDDQSLNALVKLPLAVRRMATLCLVLHLFGSRGGSPGLR